MMIGARSYRKKSGSPAGLMTGSSQLRSACPAVGWSPTRGRASYWTRSIWIFWIWNELMLRIQSQTMSTKQNSVRLAIFKHIPAKAKTCTIQILMQPPTSFRHENLVSEELQASHFKLNNNCQPILSQDSWQMEYSQNSLSFYSNSFWCLLVSWKQVIIWLNVCLVHLLTMALTFQMTFTFVTSEF